MSKKKVLYSAIQRSAARIATATGKDKSAVVHELVASHERNGFEVVHPTLPIPIVYHNRSTQRSVATE